MWYKKIIESKPLNKWPHIVCAVITYFLEFNPSWTLYFSPSTSSTFSWRERGGGCDILNNFIFYTKPSIFLIHTKAFPIHTL